jgi:GNAT superfamily N-acetyltransferase
MDRTAALALFDAEMRQNPVPEAGFRVDRKGSVVRLIGAEDHCIVYSRFSPGELAAGVAEQTEEFRARGQFLEWKVYSHDEPHDLSRWLARAGYVPKPTETLMVYDLATPLEAPELPPGIEIRRITDDSGLEDYVAAEQAAFGRPEPTARRVLEGRLGQSDVAAYVAYRAGAPVAAGRVERAPGRSFAGIWGGGTAPSSRRLGIYRSLVAERAKWARERGAGFLMVEALVDTSRPILERLGFVALAEVVGWELAPEPAVPGAARGAQETSKRPGVRPGGPQGHA